MLTYDRQIISERRRHEKRNLIGRQVPFFFPVIPYEIELNRNIYNSILAFVITDVNNMKAAAGDSCLNPHGNGFENRILLKKMNREWQGITIYTRLNTKRSEMQTYCRSFLLLSRSVKQTEFSGT